MNNNNNNRKKSVSSSDSSETSIKIPRFCRRMEYDKPPFFPGRIDSRNSHYFVPVQESKMPHYTVPRMQYLTMPKYGLPLCTDVEGLRPGIDCPIYTAPNFNKKTIFDPPKFLAPTTANASETATANVQKSTCYRKSRHDLPMNRTRTRTILDPKVTYFNEVANKSCLLVRPHICSQKENSSNDTETNPMASTSQRSKIIEERERLYRLNKAKLEMEQSQRTKNWLLEEHVKMSDRDNKIWEKLLKQIPEDKPKKKTENEPDRHRSVRAIRYETATATANAAIKKEVEKPENSKFRCAIM